VVDLVAELQAAVPVLSHLQPSLHSQHKPSSTIPEALGAPSGVKHPVAKSSKLLDLSSRPDLSSALSQST
jgi:hypothetical protein